MKDIASFFKVLADETRLAMLWLLFNHKEICVCDFIEVLRITQSRASRHLRTLHGAGLLADRRDGLWKYYALRPAGKGFLKAHLKALRTTLAGRPDAAELLRKLSIVVEKRKAGRACCE